MTKKVIENLDQITAEWLTRVLKRSGALDVGAVDGLEILDRLERELSTNAQLRLNYVDGSTGALPARLFLKIVNTAIDEDDTLLSTEVDYYTRDYLGVEDAPIARCYDAAVSEDNTRYHILLEDLSETHVDSYKIPRTRARPCICGGACCVARALVGRGASRGGRQTDPWFRSDRTICSDFPTRCRAHSE